MQPININKNEYHYNDKNIFTEEFFGGADVIIKINDSETDLSYINFSVQEQEKPIYGYNSRTFDDVATGNRIVTGVFKIPISNTNVNVSDPMTNNIEPQSNSMEYKIPEWMYNYENNSNENSLSAKNFKLINQDYNLTKAQEKLKNKGYNIDVNGVLDYKSRRAIYDYKKDSNIVVNDRCDNELLNKLGLTKDENVYLARRKTQMKLYPDNSASDLDVVEPQDKILLQKEYNDKWFLAQLNNGRKGYIKWSNVYKQIL